MSTNNSKSNQSPLPSGGAGGGFHVLDITKEHCPMTFVKTKIELSKLQPGDTLEVLLSEGEPLDNVPAMPASRCITSSEWSTWRERRTE